MQDYIPPQPKNSIRIVLELNKAATRLDSVLLPALKSQKEDLNLRNITRTKFKELFNNRQIFIKGQPSRPASGVARGTTYVDVIWNKVK